MICEHCGNENADYDLEQERGDSYNYRAAITCTQPACRHTVIVYGDSVTDVTDAITKIEEAAYEKKSKENKG